MKKLANKMVTLTFIGIFVAGFTFVSIPLSFKWWHFNGLLIPAGGTLTLFYIAIRIEIIRKKCNIKSSYDLSMLLNGKKIDAKTSLVKGRNFHVIGALYSMIAAVVVILILFLSFCLFM